MAARAAWDLKALGRADRAGRLVRESPELADCPAPSASQAATAVPEACRDLARVAAAEQVPEAAEDRQVARPARSSQALRQPAAALRDLQQQVPEAAESAEPAATAAP